MSTIPSTSLEIYPEDQRLYVKMTDVLYGEPVQVTSWYPIGMDEHEYRRNYGDQALGQPVTLLGDGVYLGVDNRMYRLLEGGRTTPTFSHTEPVPPPVQRGRKLPLRWEAGRWEKQTRAGWKPA